MNAHVAVKAYTKVGVEYDVTTADPHKLISMLYQGALLAIANARNGILRKDVRQRVRRFPKRFPLSKTG